jgi:hypothetical protein
MTEAETGLAEFSGTRGHKGAHEAAEILKKFLKECNGMGQQAGQCLAFQPGLSKCMGNSVAQLLAEMGLGMGQGQGQGMGGYSARRNTMNNMGLYGGLPALAGQNFHGGGQGDNPAQGTGSFTGGTNASEPDLFDSAANQSASSSGSGQAPLEYRQKVGQYLRRLAEDLEE